jgi:cobalamin biosynthesis Co2+ chelatase CbiK
MKSVLATFLFLTLSVVHAHAAPNSPTLTDEMQHELDSIDENVVLDNEDQDFLDTKTDAQAVNDIKTKDGIFWGQPIEAVQKAEVKEKVKKSKETL